MGLGPDVDVVDWRLHNRLSRRYFDLHGIRRRPIVWNPAEKIQLKSARDRIKAVRDMLVKLSIDKYSVDVQEAEDHLFSAIRSLEWADKEEAVPHG